MAITSYAELQTAVANWLHRSDLTSRIPEFIALGESYLNREITSPERIYGTTVNTSTSDRYAALPTGSIEIIALFDDGVELKRGSIAEVGIAADGNSSGKPQSYATTYRIEFDRVSNQVYSFACQYKKKLDIASEVNFVLTKHPDAYLYASLVAAMPYIRNDERTALFKPMLDEVINDINSSAINRYELRVDAALLRGEPFDINKG